MFCKSLLCSPKLHLFDQKQFKRLQRFLLEVSEMEVGCRMAIGPLGRAGVLMVGITGIDRPVPIMGAMPGIVVIGIGVRMGTLGIMDTFGIVPIPEKAQRITLNRHNTTKCDTFL